MPEPNTAVVEVPPEVKERQETDAYIAEREKAKELPPPKVEIETTTPEQAAEPPKVEEVVLTPEQIETNAVDAYLRERDYDRKQKRKNRGGVQARIDELTKETAKLKEVVEATKSVVEAPKPAETKAIEPVVEAPKAAPKMAEYTDVEKYNADMALWAAAQTKNVPVEVPKPPVVDTFRKEEFDKFLERGKVFVTSHPDFNMTLEAAHVRGLTMSEQARVAITRLAAPEVAYWLAKPENDLAARQFMKMDDFQQVIEVGKIAERLTVRASDFVSGAPAPSSRLNGTTRADVQLDQVTDTDEWIRLRKQAKKTGIRR